ncbi:hypothetical protein ES319_1Z160200v1 [Gossypium barbadense]|uniref:Uncharacterized protein n=1 Tax=Gossypium barbadense TaxID=3634 RepID=A0A5J5NET7_GOSBA|nr:hypothetical protein ES319_1Z160200v1 [Gossypium barbadense]
MNNLDFNLSPPDISPAIKLHRFVCWVLAQIDSRVQNSLFRSTSHSHGFSF